MMWQKKKKVWKQSLQGTQEEQQSLSYTPKKTTLWPNEKKDTCKNSRVKDNKSSAATPQVAQEYNLCS